jgi:general secretion pathway protein M
MSGLPQGRAGQAAALGIVAVLALAIHLAILSPVLAFYAGNEAMLAQRGEVLRRYESAVRDLPRLRASAQHAAETPQTGALLLAGDSDALAGAELQTALKQLAEQQGARMASAASLPAQDEGAFRRVGVRIALTGDLPVLTSLLRSMREAQPALVVGHFELRSDGGADGEEANPTLIAALDVFGYRAK